MPAKSTLVRAAITPRAAAAKARESIDSVLAKNLVAARVIAGLTQLDLANSAGVSRATVAQLETGYSDPRLSTVVELARALGVAPIVLLCGTPEVEALASLGEGVGDQGPKPSPMDLARIRDYASSGMLKDRVRAARLGAAVARGGVETPVGIAVTAGLFSAALPGAGTTVGTILGRLLGS
jgi:transcriptional regulator with XRE-family HTH domain